MSHLRSKRRAFLMRRALLDRLPRQLTPRGLIPLFSYGVPCNVMFLFSVFFFVFGIW